MHCPQCGQQQVSDETRFCSRCGFPLSAVAEVLGLGGLLPTPVEPGASKMSARRKGVRQGAMLFLLGAVIVPILGIIASSRGIMGDFFEILTAIAAIIFFVGGIARMLYAGIFEESARPSVQLPTNFAPPPNVIPPATRAATALPPPQSRPVTDYRPPRWNTAEVLRPPSITEGTTKLLDKEENPFNGKRED